MTHAMTPRQYVESMPESERLEVALRILDEITWTPGVVVRWKEKYRALTPRACTLCEFLYARRGQWVPGEVIRAAMSPERQDRISPVTFRQHLRDARKAGIVIETQYGRGYRIPSTFLAFGEDVEDKEFPLDLDPHEIRAVREALTSTAFMNLVGSEEWGLTETAEEHLWSAIKKAGSATS